MKNRLIKDSFLILFANSITYLATIINTRIISAEFSLTEYGYRAQILSIVTICVSIFSIGLSNCPTYFIPLLDGSKKYSVEKIVRNLYFIALLSCFIMFIIISIGYPYIVRYFDNEFLFCYKFIIIIMVMEQIFYSFYSGIQVAQHKAIKSTICNLLKTIVTIIVIFICCEFFHSLYNVILFTLIVECAFCIYTMFDSSHPFINMVNWFDMQLIKDMLKYCIPLGVSGITSIMCAQIDKLFVGHFYSPDQLAIYSNMCTELPLAAISGAFIAIISPYIVKFIAENKVLDAIKLWDYVIEFVGIILFSIIAGLFTFSKQAIYILYSDKYIEGYYLFRIFVLVEITRITYFGLILRSYGKSTLILLCSMLTLIINVILNSISYFVFNGGLIGFAISTMISTFAIQILQLIISSKVAKIKLKNIFPWKNLLKIGMVNICFCIIYTFFINVLNISELTNIIVLIPIVFIWIVVYFFIMKNRIILLYTKIKNFQLN